MRNQVANAFSAIRKRVLWFMLRGAIDIPTALGPYETIINQNISLSLWTMQK